MKRLVLVTVFVVILTTIPSSVELVADERILFVQSEQDGLFLADASFESIETVIADSFDPSEAAWTPDARSIVYSSNVDGPFDLYRFDLETAQAMQLTDTIDPDRDPIVMPDGRILFTRAIRQGKSASIFIMDSDGRNVTNISSDPSLWNWNIRVGVGDYAGRLLYLSERGGQREIYSCRPDGSDERKLQLPSFWDDLKITGFDIHPSGGTLIIAAVPHNEGFMSDRLYTMRLDGSSQPEQIAGDPGVFHGRSQYSSDGTKIYYTREKNLIYRCNADGTDHELLFRGDGWTTIISIRS